MKLFILGLAALSTQSSAITLEELGERLFQDGRFSERYYKVSKGNPNYRISVSSANLDFMPFQGQLVVSPFRGETQSCASCHMVDQGFDEYGMRSYSDFAERTLVPRRRDSQFWTLRNTPSLIGIGSAFSKNRFSHHDGKFSDHSQTVLGNFTGRNMGWLKGEEEIARDNIVSVIVRDNGKSDLAQEFGGPYKKVFSEVFQKDIKEMDKAQILKSVTLSVTEYLNGLDFETNEEGQYIGSAYDKFLLQNNIRTIPLKGESNETYTSYLKKKFRNLKNPKFIEEHELPTHKASTQFKEQEWRGLKAFFNISKNGQKAMCINCHTAPLFTDQFFHNVGVTQVEYERVHGLGAFNNLKIPNLKDRKDLFFLSRPDKKSPSATDLGVWNFYKRNDKLSRYIEAVLCEKEKCKAPILSSLIARVKTPSLRNLGHSSPYFHNGSMNSLKKVLAHYRGVSIKAKKRELRNIDQKVKVMILDLDELSSIEAFINSLNENYE